MLIGERQNAPKPKEPPQGISTRAQDNPGGRRARFLMLLEENWQSSDPRFWQVQPDHRYRFTVDELQWIEDEMTVKEIEVFYELYDFCEKKMQAANRLRLPYALSEWLIKQRERRDREEEEYEQWVEEEEEIGYIMAQLDEEELSCRE
ncbi:MAG: hypothetical protein O7B35_13620 [Deltaproteobacteria bacterium]|nr:hypothetical protein [Deltaproteobacteria bacterium]